MEELTKKTYNKKMITIRKNIGRDAMKLKTLKILSLAGILCSAFQELSANGTCIQVPNILPKGQTAQGYVENQCSNWAYQQCYTTGGCITGNPDCPLCYCNCNP